MQLASTSGGMRLSVARSRTVVPLPRLAPALRPCKPASFKENNRPDSIDASTRTTAMPTPAGPPGFSDPLLTPAALKPVDLGPVASALYPLLTFGTLLGAVAAVTAPAFTGRLVFQATTTPTTHVLIMSAGAMLLPTVVANLQVKRAADNGLLGSPVFKLLVTGCLLGAVLGLVVLSQAVSLRNPVLGGTLGTVMGVATITAAYTLAKIRESGQLVPSMRGWLAGAIDLITPHNLTSALYSFLTVGLLGMGLVLFTSEPGVPSNFYMAHKDAVFIFCTRLAGAASIANAIFAFTIKEAADQGRQRSPTFKWLNGSLAAAFIIDAAVKAYAMSAGLAYLDRSTYGVLGCLAAGALFTGFEFLTSSG